MISKYFVSNCGADYALPFNPYNNSRPFAVGAFSLASAGCFDKVAQVTALPMPLLK
jgi:hypothetical protein